MVEVLVSGNWIAMVVLVTQCKDNSLEEVCTVVTKVVWRNNR